MWDRHEQLTWRESSSAAPNAGAESSNQLLRVNSAPDGTPHTAFQPNNSIVPALLKFFGLKQQPFGVTPDPSFLYLSRTHREALASLVYGIETGLGFLALIAQPGMGKTTLLFHLLDKFRASARTAFLFQTQCTSKEFLQFLSSDLGFTSGSQDFVRMHEEFNYHLMKEARAGKRFIVVVDEAQNLDSSVLETIRLLSNFETPSAKLIQIVLSGQPELGNKLGSDEMVQLQQRVSSFIRLDPFSAKDTEQYIQHRLRIAGYNRGSLLTSDALAAVTDFSKGIPRNINTFCFNALSLAFAKQQQTIDATIAREVISDLEISLFGSQPNRNPERATTSDSDLSLHSSQVKKEEVHEAFEASLHAAQSNHNMKNEVTNESDVSLDAPPPNDEEEITAVSELSPPASEPKHIMRKQPELLPAPNWKQVQTGGRSRQAGAVGAPPDEFTPLSGATDYSSIPLAEAKEYMNNFIRSLKTVRT